MPKLLCVIWPVMKNITPIKKIQGRSNRAEIDKGKTIECDVKSYQEKKNIAKCTKL